MPSPNGYHADEFAQWMFEHYTSPLSGLKTHFFTRGDMLVCWEAAQRALLAKAGTAATSHAAVPDRSPN